MSKSRLLATFAGVTLAACASVDPSIPPPLRSPSTAAPQPEATVAAAGRPGFSIEPTPQPPAPERLASGPKSAAAGSLAELPDSPADIVLSFDQVPLPALVQAIYADVLKRNVSIEPAIAARKDLVTLRTGNPQSPRRTAELMRQVLKSYGVNVVEAGNLVRIVPDTAGSGYLPEIRRGRALPDTPEPLRPVFQLVELAAVRNTDIAGIVKQMMGSRINVTEDPGRNAVLLSGNLDDVSSAMDAIQVLDQPMLKGRHSVRINPTYWSADELARRLNEVLQAEGYSVGPISSGVQYPVTLLPVAAVNAVLVFAVDARVADHVAEWARTLDRPTERAIGRNFFTYAVQNTDAQALATTLQQLISGGALSTGLALTPGQVGAAVAGAVVGGAAVVGPSGAGAARSANVVTNKATNTLIFLASADDYPQIRALLQSLDRPSRQALIEVTVAELQIDNDTEIGVEWLVKNLRVDGSGIVAGTTGLGLATTGFNLVWKGLGPDRIVILNALATSNRASILSSPRVIARNGETASILVGQDVPIVTSQQTSLAGSGVNPGVLQTIQYQNTGVILKVTPVIHSSDQIDLDVSQEVSAAQSTQTGVNISPTFLKRKLETKLTMRNGSTVLLGGLISTDNSGGSTGIPFLKDIPLVGQLFSNTSLKRQKRELIILMTPYIINDDGDARAFTDAFRRMVGPWATTPADDISPTPEASPKPNGAAKPAGGPNAPPVVEAPAAPSDTPSATPGETKPGTPR